jgi:predicted HTH transcriptional regulator
VTDQEFETILSLGYETNGVEFKGPEARKKNDPFLGYVIKAILGMANRRDGGLIILGIGSTDLEPIGLSDAELATWSKYDDVTASVNEYASPNAKFDLEIFEYKNEKKFIIIRVREFDEIPVLCTKDYPDHRPGKRDKIMRRGGCYVRSRHKPETAEIPSEEEMRELLELAIDKGVRRFVTRAQRAGLFPTYPTNPSSPSDEELFRRQIEDMG